jgi:CRP/FNR family transcriptional regulator, cyclic AMP receptor protein
MACNPEMLKQVPLFTLLDEEETAVLAGQVELKKFAPRQRIYRIGDAGGRAYVMVSGAVRVTTVDQDHQEVVVDEPAFGDFFGFASMLEQTPHQTNAVALEETVCVEVDRDDIAVLLQRKPHAGMDMLTVLGRQFHSSQQLVRVRSTRNPNEVIDKESTLGERIADSVARFGGSWTFIITFGVVLLPLYEHQFSLASISMGSLSLHSTKSVSLYAGRHPGARHHDEPEPPGHKRSSAQRTRLRSQPSCRVRDSRLGPQAESIR